MSGKLFAAAVAAAALATAPAYAAPTKQQPRFGGGSDISRLVQAIRGEVFEHVADICRQYTPGFLQKACDIDDGVPGHCKGRGKGHDIGKGKGHDKDDDCPVSS